MMRARSRAFAVVLGGAIALLCCSAGGCGGSSSTGPGGSWETGCTIFVDASHSGTETGTQLEPYNAIEENCAFRVLHCDDPSLADVEFMPTGTRSD